MKKNSIKYNFPAKKFLLLTGAGFTHNFGAPLASELWTWIFNDSILEKAKCIKNLMRSNFNFEEVIQKIRNNPNSSDAEKSDIEQALQNAYSKLDEKIKLKTASQSAFIGILNEFIADSFGGDSTNCIDNDPKGFIFTLNQDLFLERFYRDKTQRPDSKLKILGIPANGYFADTFSNSPVNLNDGDNFVEQIQKDLGSGLFFYIKLHGSQNWFRNSKFPQMVIGTNKTEQIKNDPLLSQYSEIFQNAICQNDKKLLIIGYGFGDSHINKIIAQGIGNGLKVYIITPERVEDFRARLMKATCGKLIWKKLEGFFPFSLEAIFSNSSSQEYKLIKDSFSVG